MRKSSAILIALITGCATEVLLCVVAVISIFSGGFGPCGSSGDFPGWLAFVHQPGVWLAELLLPDATISQLPIIVGTTAAELGLAAYLAMPAAKRFFERH
jgi:hypothetical protein